MSLRIWRFFALVLAAPALAMESAHLLELPQKLRYAGFDAQLIGFGALVCSVLVETPRSPARS